MKTDIEEAERHFREKKRELFDLQKRLDRVPNHSPLSQVYEPENLLFPSPGPTRHVVVAAAGRGRHVHGRHAPAVAAPGEDSDDAVYAPFIEEEPRRRAFRGLARGRPAHAGDRQPPSSSQGPARGRPANVGGHPAGATASRGRGRGRGIRKEKKD